MEQTMISSTTVDSTNRHYESCLRSHRYWPWFIGLGTGLIVLGVMAVGSAFIATLSTMLVIGWLIIASGVVQVVNAVLAGSIRGFFGYLCCGLLQLVVGGLIVERPLLAAESMTLLIAVLFLVGGLARLLSASIERYPGWGWGLASGAVTVVLGLSIWRQWPASGLWVIGLFVGIDLIMSGWTWVMLGLTLKTIRGNVESLRPALRA